MPPENPKDWNQWFSKYVPESAAIGSGVAVGMTPAAAAQQFINKARGVGFDRGAIIKTAVLGTLLPAGQNAFARALTSPPGDVSFEKKNQFNWGRTALDVGTWVAGDAIVHKVTGSIIGMAPTAKGQPLKITPTNPPAAGGVVPLTPPPSRQYDVMPTTLPSPAIPPTPDHKLISPRPPADVTPLEPPPRIGRPRPPSIEAPPKIGAKTLSPANFNVWKSGRNAVLFAVLAEEATMGLATQRLNKHTREGLQGLQDINTARDALTDIHTLLSHPANGMVATLNDTVGRWISGDKQAYNDALKDYQKMIYQMHPSLRPQTKTKSSPGSGS